jgi:hypothetical protein
VTYKQNPPHLVECPRCDAEVDVTGRPDGGNAECPDCHVIWTVAYDGGYANGPWEDGTTLHSPEEPCIHEPADWRGCVRCVTDFSETWAND